MQNLQDSPDILFLLPSSTDVPALELECQFSPEDEEEVFFHSAEMVLRGKKQDYGFLTLRFGEGTQDFLFKKAKTMKAQ